MKRLSLGFCGYSDTEMRALACLILLILGALCFGIYRFTGSFVSILGTLLLLFSLWCFICAAWPKCREPNVKFPGGDTVRGCLSWAACAFFIGAVLFFVGLKLKV